MTMIDKSKPVLLTGATGYVAGALVEKFLAEGFTIHAPIRNPDNKEKTQYLDALAERLEGTIRYYKADLLDYGSYDEAMDGCELVFHTASPFSLNVNDPQKELVDPALKGTQNVLESANKCPSVKRIVLTSSVAAIYGDNADLEDIEEEAFTEDHWNTSSSLKHQPYAYSKTLAEKEAWRLAALQDRWDLVVINPSLVIGPAVNPYARSESFNIVRQIGDGNMRLGAPAYSLGVVDVRDLSEAHYRAGFYPEAEGRHIISHKTEDFLSLATYLQDEFGGSHHLPKKHSPKFLVWLFGPLKGISRKMVSRNLAYTWKADNTKSKEKLNIHYRPVKESISDMFRQMVQYKRL